MKRDHDPVAPQIIDEASDWFVAMRDESVPADQREAFAHWLRASPVHVRAYLDVVRLWSDAAHISADCEADADKILEAVEAANNVVSLRADGTPSRALSPRQRGEGRGGGFFSLSRLQERVGVRDSTPSPRDSGERLGVRGKFRRVLVAASVLLACGLASGIAWWQLNRAPTYVTDVGEQRVLTLEDGSTVRLNSRSKLSVHLTPELRQVDLRDGQALFEVEKDPARPFVVRSGDVAIRAVGTSFDVYRKSSSTVVTVIEGQVEVTASPTAEASVGAGEQVTVTRAGAIERRPKANVAAATSWLQQELVFDGEPLSAVIDEFNRYMRTPIVLTDPSLANERINAVFHTTSPDSLLRFVTRFDGVEIEESDTEIRISRKHVEE